MTYKLTYSIGGKVIETPVANVPYCMCVQQRKDLSRLQGYKAGKFEITRNDLKL